MSITYIRLIISALFMFTMLRCHKSDNCAVESKFPSVDGWNIRYVKTPLQQTGDIIDFYFLDKETGFLLTKNSNLLYKTVDGGNNWSEIKLVNFGDYEPSNLFFYSESIGWVILDTLIKNKPKQLIRPRILFTIDGGNTWKNSQMNIKAKPIYVFFGDVMNGFSIFQESNALYYLFCTTDNGKNWIKNTTINLGNIAPRWYNDYGTIYVVDVFNKIWKSIDFGKTWLPIIQSENEYIYQIHVGKGNKIYYTTDKGLFLYEEGSSIKQLTENKTHIIFFGEGFGLTIQKKMECNENNTSMNFNTGTLCFRANIEDQDSWLESTNSWILSDWRTIRVDTNYAFCAFERFLYFAEKTR